MSKTPTASQLWVVLARCYEALSTLVEHSIAKEGLCLSDFMILEALLHKGPLTITEIQGKVLLATGSMTAAVDRLENKGLIARKMTPEDRRARRLELTPAGRKLITAVFESHNRELEAWMSGLTGSEKQQTYGVLKKLGLSAAAIHEHNSIERNPSCMSTPIVGLHHVTAIASDPQRNLDFYTQVLGLRFVKRTINFDDPGTYHFYFGDDIGSPGTILTFFPWPNTGRGRAGAGEVIATAFSIPAGSLPFWTERLQAKGVAFTEGHRFGSPLLSLHDPDGMILELVEHQEKQTTRAPRYSGIHAASAIQGFYGVTLLERSLEQTEPVLDLMGLARIGEEAGIVRFAPQGEAFGRFIDIKIDPKAPVGRMGAGTVHHIAFRNVDDAAQAEWRKVLARHLSVTPVQDRDYFHSIYFREPGGVLFEMATDNPGFLIDEPVESLGEALRIPAWYEPMRPSIEARLAPITLHKPAQPALAGVSE